MDMKLSSDVLEDIATIMAASDPVVLFGPNEKRAKIRYRRLLRSVHPDANGGDDTAQEATQRLNSLWESYGRMMSPNRHGDADRAPDTSHFVHELARTERFVLFSEGDRWMSVARGRGSRPATTADAEAMMRFSEIVSGSPVFVPHRIGEKIIPQVDGNHLATTYEVPGFFSAEHHMLSLADIKSHVPNGVMDPADAAWVIKRLLFATAGLAKARLRPEEGADLADVAILDTDAHMLVILDADRLVQGTGDVDEQRAVIGRAAEIVSQMLDTSDSGGRQTRRLAAFLRGVMVDHVTETATLLAEFGELLLELFGEPRFHKMRIV